MSEKLLCLSQNKKRAPKEHREMTQSENLCENKEKRLEPK